jgi:hypothetical protein
VRSASRARRWRLTFLFAVLALVYAALLIGGPFGTDDAAAPAD